MVLPDRKAAAEEEAARNKEALDDNPKARVNWHHKNFLRKWWLHSYPRAALLAKLRVMPRYIACSRTTKRPIFVFVSNAINPNDALQVFTFSDDYSFGILQSDTHWRWFVERCSTLKGDFRYTSNTSTTISHGRNRRPSPMFARGEGRCRASRPPDPGHGRA